MIISTHEKCRSQSRDEKTNVVLVAKPDETRLFLKTERRLKDSIKTNLKNKT